MGDVILAVGPPPDLWGEGSAAVVISVGVDFNLRCIGFAVIVRRKSYAEEVLGALSRLARRYECCAVCLDGSLFFAALLPLVEPFKEYVAPRLRSLVEKYVGELEVLETLGVEVVTVRPHVPGVADRELVVEVLRGFMAEYGLTRVPELFNVELGIRVRRLSRELEEVEREVAVYLLSRGVMESPVVDRYLERFAREVASAARGYEDLLREYADPSVPLGSP